MKTPIKQTTGKSEKTVQPMSRSWRSNRAPGRTNCDTTCATEEESNKDNTVVTSTVLFDVCSNENNAAEDY